VQDDRLWILVAKRQCGEASEDELAELKGLLKEDLFSGFSAEMTDRLWKMPLISVPDDRQKNKLTWNEVEKRILGHGKRAQQRERVVMMRWLAVAGLALLLATTFFVCQRQRKESKTGHFSPGHTSVAQKAGSPVELPDGTQVWLNKNSRLTYDKHDFGLRDREVTLKGEAFFDVTGNEQMPFVIHAGKVKIKVRGTAFNVKAYPGDKAVVTTLIRGKVAVSFCGHSVMLKPDEKIIVPLEAPDRLHAISVDSLYSLTTVVRSEAGMIPETSWMKGSKGKLRFDNETFGILAGRLEAQYGLEFRFANDRLKHLRFSGMVDAETIEVTLKAMQLSRHFNFHISGNIIYIED
jgi:ferric-dicitrate binding protein FerR (iron transport regulator)